MRRPAPKLAAVALLAALGLLAPLRARAVIPSAVKISNALALANRAAGRAGPLLLDVKLRIGGGEVLATGVLASHPTGLARLELRSGQGFVERHLLQGNAYTASRDGELLATPRPFLPPVFLLQATSGAALRAALGSFGVDPERAVLGRAGDHDCYVLGGRALPGTGAGPAPLPSLWIDVESYEVVRIERADGVRFEFGPSVSFDGSRVPGWIAIDVPGQPTARLEIERAARADAPAAAFGADWLTAAEQR